MVSNAKGRCNMSEKEVCRYSDAYKKFITSFLVKPALNLGCDGWKIDAVNVDYNRAVKPDKVWDLNRFPYPFRDRSFSTIFMVAALEHLREPKRVVGECRRILKDGGRVVAVVPSKGSRFYRAKNHIQFFDKKSLRETFSDFDARVFGYRGDTTEISPWMARLVGMFRGNLLVCIARKRASGD
jgi:SAM-dependent methyltransferase